MPANINGRNDVSRRKTCHNQFFCAQPDFIRCFVFFYSVWTFFLSRGGGGLFLVKFTILFLFYFFILLSKMEKTQNVLCTIMEVLLFKKSIRYKRAHTPKHTYIYTYTNKTWVVAIEQLVVHHSLHNIGICTNKFC